jgi:polysaccharide biosynthesis protein PslG
MKRARRLMLPVSIVAASALLALVATQAIGAGSAHRASHHAKHHARKPPPRVHAAVGIGDEQPTMFANRFYRALHTHIARYVTPYDVMTNHRHNDLPRLRAWLRAAARSHVQPLVAFYHSDRTPRRMPSVKLYTRDVKRFLRAFPGVHLLQPWDEANRGNVRTRGDSFNSPNAKQSAHYYLALKHACRHCTVVGLDVLDSTDPRATVHYIEEFKHHIPRKQMPHLWGLHNYSDTNRFHPGGTRAVLAHTSGQVWLTETGGIAKLSTSFPFNLSRQSRATAYMFKLASMSRRITRVYIFQWTGGVARHEYFDAGLSNVRGKPRPAYCVAYRYIRHTSRCPYRTVHN